MYAPTLPIARVFSAASILKATSLFQSLFRPPLNSDKTSQQLDNTQHTHPYETHSASHILSLIRV